MSYWGNNSTNTGLSAVPASGGTGFQAWTSDEVGGAAVGFFTSNSTQFSGGNINSDDNNAFGMYGVGSGNVARCFRKMINPLMVGGIFSVKFAAQFRNGRKGINVYRQGNGLFSFRIAGNKYEYSTNLITYNDTLWSYSGASVFTLKIERPGFNYIVFQVSRDGTSDNITVPLSGLVDVNEIEFFVGDTESGGQNNLYFNFLSAYNAYR